jgi:TorA maturation chaperone TorD
MTLDIHLDIRSEQRTNNDLDRGVLYNLFASILGRKIDEAWLNPGFQSKLRFGLPETEGKIMMLDALAQATAQAKAFQEIQLDFDALFIVPGPKLTFPYESCYTHRNPDGSYGRLWQEPAQALQQILSNWQINFAEGWNLIPDHIAVELFFMAELCRRRAEAEGSDRKALMEWQVRFFNVHIKNWVFELLNTLEQKAETDFYRGCAQLLYEFLKEEEAELGCFLGENM